MYTNQQWQHEERLPGFPLGHRQPTQITALAGDHLFDIFANKKQFNYSYRHCYDVRKINQVEFSGEETPVQAYHILLIKCAYSNNSAMRVYLNGSNIHCINTPAQLDTHAVVEHATKPMFS